MRRLLALCSLLVIAGCTQQGWQKPLATRAGLASDLAGCREAAQREAVTAAPHALGPSRLSTGSGDIDNPVAGVPQELLLQQSLRNHCMQERGYTLGQGGPFAKGLKPYS